MPQTLGVHVDEGAEVLIDRATHHEEGYLQREKGFIVKKKDLRQRGKCTKKGLFTDKVGTLGALQGRFLRQARGAASILL